MSKQPWALILGASSGFGEATAMELARAGMNIFGVHLDRRDKLAARRRAAGEHSRARPRSAVLQRQRLRRRVPARHDRARSGTRLAQEPPGTLRVLLHSLAFGSLKPLAGAEQVVSKKQLEITVDTMGHSLVYWVQECLRAGLFEWGGRIFAMTSAGGTRAIPNYGAVSAAKAALESHIRQLALELAPAGITANAILAGVTDTPALRLIPGHEKIMEIAQEAQSAPRGSPRPRTWRAASPRSAIPPRTG